MSRSADRLTALDRPMLGAGKRWPQDIDALVILDGATLRDPAGELRIGAVREAIASRLPLVPRFRQVIHAPGRGLGVSAHPMPALREVSHDNHADP